MSEDPKEKPERRGIFVRMRRNFLTGLVVVLPISLTIWLVWAFTGFVDNTILPLLPEAYRPMSYIGYDLRGTGIIIFLIFTTMVGAIAKGLFGRRLLQMGENIVDRIPLVRTIYNGIKQILETITSSTDSNFDRACLVQYPRKGIYALGFISKATGAEVLHKSGQDALYSVFLPTTPNPTSGFLLFFKKSEVVILDMSVEEAAKLVISAGIVEPPFEAKKPSSKQKKAPSGAKIAAN